MRRVGPWWACRTDLYCTDLSLSPQASEVATDKVCSQPVIIYPGLTLAQKKCSSPPLLVSKFGSRP